MAQEQNLITVKFKPKENMMKIMPMRPTFFTNSTIPSKHL